MYTENEVQLSDTIENETVPSKTDVDEVQEVVNEQELRYWKAVMDNPGDFTSWTYLLQFVEQEVGLPKLESGKRFS
jgi:hypothetical protein